MYPSPIGSFLAGVIMPRKGGLAVALTEKLEDMVSIVFLPLVNLHSGHALSGLTLTDSTSRSLVCPLILACSIMLSRGCTQLELYQ
jgi:K+:H+ antiporter